MDLYLIIIALVGLIIGSFLNVCIFRIPINQELFDEELYPKHLELKNRFLSGFSVSFPPRSICPNCFAELKWYHNIPFFSWVFLRGKCAFCSNKISIRYPLVELVSAISAVVSVIFYGYTASALIVYILLASFIVIACIDYDHFMIPDVITYPLTLVGIVASVANQYYPFLRYPFNANWQDLLLGLAAGAGALYLVAKIYLLIRRKEGLGMGDVKLLAVIGAWLGYQGSFFTIFVGSIIGSVGGIIALLLKGRGLSQEIPFGPYLVIAASIYIIMAS
jgi:leader peptidase (prepilin peptidase)/N-methyltransferase